MNKREEAERNRLIDRIEALETLVKELEENINLKADFIDATINQMAGKDQEIWELKEQLKRCFRGETTTVRNELVLEALRKETERVLELPQDDIREYLARKYETYG